MVELREDGSIPGPDVYGRVYRLVDPITGAVGFSMWASDLPEDVAGQERFAPALRGCIL